MPSQSRRCDFHPLDPLRLLRRAVEAYEVMSRPGVVFTPEQREKIQRLLDEGRGPEAAEVVNDLLDRQFTE